MTTHARVTANGLNVRTTPGGSILKVLPMNTRVEVLSRNGSWINIREAGVDGFVSSRYIAIEESQESSQSSSILTLARVSANKLNLRAAPSGKILNLLSKDDELKVLNKEGSWLKVRFKGEEGFVSQQYVDWTPPSDTPQHRVIEESVNFRYENNRALAPDDTVFARKFRRGVYNSGNTSIAEFLDAGSNRFSGVSKSLVSVMTAVSLNEGKFEAINTWDNAFLSAGIFQWTAGTKSDAGELPAVVKRFHDTFPLSFENLFGQYGLEVSGVRYRKGVAPQGYFKLNGEILTNAEAKASLRTLPWAYRFWLAGQDDDFREAQTAHAMERIDLFYHLDNRRIGEFYVSDYVTSEFGVALLLDQHVNRPGHVPRILSNAVTAVAGELDTQHPNTWGDDEESHLLNEYLALRTQTSMTDGEQRAETVRNQVKLGVISNKRNSFKV